MGEKNALKSMKRSLRKSQTLAFPNSTSSPWIYLYLQTSRGELISTHRGAECRTRKLGESSPDRESSVMQPGAARARREAQRRKTAATGRGSRRATCRQRSHVFFALSSPGPVTAEQPPSARGVCRKVAPGAPATRWFRLSSGGADANGPQFGNATHLFRAFVLEEASFSHLRFSLCLLSKFLPCVISCA